MPWPCCPSHPLRGAKRQAVDGAGRRRDGFERLGQNEDGDGDEDENGGGDMGGLVGIPLHVVAYGDWRARLRRLPPDGQVILPSIQIMIRRVRKGPFHVKLNIFV